jgi:hypothetical protein
MLRGGGGGPPLSRDAMRWLGRALRVTGLAKPARPDERKAVVAAAFRVGGVPWWEAPRNQVLVRYRNWDTLAPEFEFALSQGWYIDLVFSVGVQRHVGPGTTRDLAEGLVSPPVRRRQDPVEVMWLRPFSMKPEASEVPSAAND